LTSLLVPDTDSLPRTALTASSGISVWVACSTSPPPEQAPRPLLWFVPEIRPAALAPWRVAQLNAVDLLRLLTRCPAENQARCRRVNLMRAVVSRLPADDVLSHVHRSSESDLRWLFDLAGVRPDEVCLHAIRHDTADHPVLLGLLLGKLLEDPPRAEQRRQQLGVAALNRVRHSASWRKDALTALLSPLRNDAVARAVIWIAAAFYSGPDAIFTPSDLQSDMALLDEEQAVSIGEETLRSAASRLVADRILHSPEPDKFQLPASRVRELLVQEGPSQVEAEAVNAVAELGRPYDATFDAGVAERVVRTIGHSVDGHLRGAETELEIVGKSPLTDDQRAHLDRVGRYLKASYRLHSIYLNAMGVVEDCDLHGVLLECASTTGWVSAGDVVARVSGPEDVFVEANLWLLRQAFTNLFDNARQEITRTGSGRGQISAVLRRYSGPGGFSGADAASKLWAVTEIQDSGPGLDEATRRGLVGGERFGMRLRGSGLGVETASQWFAQYGGHLDISPEPSSMGGARLVVWLPLRVQ
jgi:signal transduction histidine kinase